MLFFLDIDGVMVPAKGWKSPEFLNDGFPAFSSKASRVLQNLISKDDTIILTTSHKSKYTIDKWKSIFNLRGINIEKVKTLPENINNVSRKDEILSWFNLNNIKENYIIIDDDKSLNDLPNYLKKKLIQPSPYIGLNEDHSVQAKAIIDERLELV
jgi:hypothetical protein